MEDQQLFVQNQFKPVVDIISEILKNYFINIEYKEINFATYLQITVNKKNISKRKKLLNNKINKDSFVININEKDNTIEVHLKSVFSSSIEIETSNV